ncbi:MAG TPA: hypothetical protein VFX16_19470, partial [Pseudonocardiaceae bacterium]|nr:hypothetical protein [Pseudonocardiaceae bacterium]
TAKGVFWLLHVVAVVVFPRLSDPDRRKGLLRRAFWLVCGTAVAATLGATLTGPTVLPFVFGADYQTLGMVVGVFALVGSLVALAELLLYANLAVRGHRISWGLWAAMTAFVGLVYAVGHRTVAGIAWLDALCLAALVGFGILVERPAPARVAKPRHADAPES